MALLLITAAWRLTEQRTANFIHRSRVRWNTMAYTPKRLLLDIETARHKGRFFGKVYETNIARIDSYSYILSVAYCWYPSTEVTVLALCDYKSYKRGNDCEEMLLNDVWSLLNEADMVIYQNGRAFDTKQLNSRFAYYRMTPPKPYKTVDTLKKLQNAFALPSNSLDFVCDYFGIGRKLPHKGEEMWYGCEEGRLKDWADMKRYNKHDVFPLLFKLYELLLPWGKDFNLNILTGEGGCYACGSTNLRNKGEEASMGCFYTRFLCRDCGAWNRDFGEPRKPKVSIRPL